MAKKKVLIFGENASALLTALAFSKAGHDVEIFDAGQHFQYESPRFFGPEFSFWPSSEHAFEDLAWLENLLQISLGGVEIDAPPVNINNDGVAPFVGFGDKNYSSIPAASVFNRSNHLQLNFNERAIYQRLREQTQVTIHEFSEVSLIRMGGAGIEAVQINSNKDYSADLYVFCQSPAELIRLAPPDFFTPRLLSRLARVNVFAQLTLTVRHPENFVADKLVAAKAQAESLVFLLPAQNDQEPVIGQLRDSHSIWHSYLPVETAEDAEGVANVFKNMRKLIDKHLGADSAKFSDELRRASIHMQPESLAEYPTDDAFDIFKKSNNNAILASPLWSSGHGLAAAVEIARRVTADWIFPESQKALPTSLEANT